jgi:hypothetical protein
MPVWGDMLALGQIFVHLQALYNIITFLDWLKEYD